MAALQHLTDALAPAATPTDKRHKVEKFPIEALQDLRRALQSSTVDSFHAAELVGAFLSDRGYGVAAADVRRATSPLDAFAGSIQRMQEQLETLALCM